MKVEITPAMREEADRLVQLHFPSLTREQVDTASWIKDRNKFVNQKGVWHQHLVGYLGELAFREVLKAASVPFVHHLAHAKKDVGYDLTVNTERLDVKTRTGIPKFAEECAFTIPEGQHEKEDLDGYVAVMIHHSLTIAWVLGTCKLSTTKNCPVEKRHWMVFPARVIPKKLLVEMPLRIREWAGQE